jgi:lipoate---protein ligase
MQFLDVTLPNLADNLAVDEALLLDAEEMQGGEVLRVWRWPAPAVVLGAGGKIADDVNETACLADGIPIARRSSGGGTVLLGRGCLSFSLVLDTESAPELRQITSSYRLILERCAKALAEVQDGIELAGTSDLAVAGRKLSGNSQQRKRRFILHHGTLLYAFDLGVMTRYLKLPPRRPDYRQSRSHTEFLMNLPDRPEEIVTSLRREWSADGELAAYPEHRMRQLVAEKYGRDDWVRRR